MFKECINQATLLSSDTITFIKASHEAGFKYIELDITKILNFLQKNDLKLLKKEILNNNLEIVSLNAIENVPILTEIELNNTIEYVRKIVTLCKELNCEILVVNPNEITEKLYREKILDRTIIFLKRITEIASKENVKIGFEFVGFNNRIINSFEGALKICNEIDSEYFGLVIDTFHIHITRASFEKIKEIPLKKLWIIHVNDAPPKPIETLTDKDRVLPGEGIMNISTLSQTLKEINYNKYISVELFNEKYWKENPFEVAKKAKESLKFFYN